MLGSICSYASTNDDLSESNSYKENYRFNRQFIPYLMENGFKCTKCGWLDHRVEKASEVGNIFPLVHKFSKPFWVKMLDQNNKEHNAFMGCYGIGISRLMWVIAEYNMAEKGIDWPESVAPADYYIIVIGEENIEKAKDFAEKLESKWKTVILDDRMWKKVGFGQKAWDCELFGIPRRIVISPKTIEAGWFEFTKRGEESEIVKF